MIPEITVEEWMSELNRQHLPVMRDSKDGWVTRVELEKLFKKSKSATHRMLQAGIEAGTVEAGRTVRPTIDGRNVPVMCYRIKEKPSVSKA